MPKILIIEDDPSMLKMLQETLLLEGYEVDFAENGKKAKELYNDYDYDAVITDIIMPEQDGFEVILDFRNRNRSHRLIAISGGGRTCAEDYLLAAENFGVAATFQKPFDRKALLAKIAEITQSKN